MGSAQIIQFTTDDALAAAAAEEWVSAIAKAHAEGRRHLVALSGGRVTRKFFAAAVARARERGVSFRDVEFFWADERCVPPDHPESNFLLASELLFKPAQIAAGAIHRIAGESDALMAAQLASEELLRIAEPKAGSFPVLDLVLLGLGEDGHVASLFPGDVRTASDTVSVFLAVKNSPKPPPQRVTLGHGPIAAAREVWVLASGKGKEAALHESLSTQGQTPLAQVIQLRANIKIFSDVNLASGL